MRPQITRLPLKRAGDVVEVPPAWIIEKIKRKKPLEDRPQPRVEVDDMPPPPDWMPQRKPEQSERGVVIIEI